MNYNIGRRTLIAAVACVYILPCITVSNDCTSAYVTKNVSSDTPVGTVIPLDVTCPNGPNNLASDYSFISRFLISTYFTVGSNDTGQPLLTVIKDLSSAGTIQGTLYVEDLKDGTPNFNERINVLLHIIHQLAMTTVTSTTSGNTPDLNECLTVTCQNGATCVDGANIYTCECKNGYSGTHCEIDLNECLNFTCQNNGTCVDDVNMYTCECTNGYSGTHCEIDLNECLNATCENGGTCVDGVNMYTCECTNGYAGTHCEIDLDECLNVTCQNGGTCVDDVNMYMCQCTNGYAGTHCEIDLNECLNATCQNGGTCVDGVNMYTCECTNGYAGTHCEIDLDECLNVTCQNGGSCVDGINMYTCQCTNGYAGTHCEIDLNECLNATCQNGGTCVDGVNMYTCECTNGYAGTHCEIDLDECLNVTCQNGGTCVDGVNMYTCQCTNGYAGTRCEIDLNECLNATCQNGGTCVDGVNMYTCECTNGYAGTHCEIDLNECLNATCQNGATCVDGVNMYTCECTNGYSGTYCEKDLNECLNATCQNDGTCVDGVNMYTCECTNGYAGTHCEIAPTTAAIPKATNPAFLECKQNTDNMGNTWHVAPSQSTQNRNCSIGYVGLVTRYCDMNGVYQDPVYNCTRKAINDIYTRMLNVTNTTDLLTDLQDATSTNANNILLAGDVETVDKILEKVTNVIDADSPTILKDTDSFLDVANNLLSTETTSAWKVLINKTGEGADSILGRLDALAEKIANSNSSSALNKEFNKSSLFLSIQEIHNCSRDIVFPDNESMTIPKWARQKRDLVQISCNEGNRYRTYSSAIYRNLSAILPLKTQNKQPSNVEINTAVMSFTFYPNTDKQLQDPIFLTFQMFNKSLDNPACSFWKINRSGAGYWSTDGCTVSEVNATDDTVRCKCNHLTNFAVLMSPSGGSIEHHAVLSYLSMIGCIISMICLLVTVVVHAVCWRAIASTRSKLLIHMCVILFLALLVFLTGVQKTDHTGMCTGIAALLHYLFLVVFFLMLAEGICLTVMVLKPLNTRDLSLPLLIPSYVIPICIVAISMGVTRLQGYGNKNFCWLNMNTGLLWAFIVPVLLVITVNAGIVVLVLRQMFGTVALKKKTDREKAWLGLRSICILLPILGITWLFGVFSVNKDTVVFQYLFAVCNSLQGVMVFVVQCFMNKKIRAAFRARRQKWLTNSSSGQEMTSRN